MSGFEIEPNIQKAETLSSEFYTSEAHFEESKEKIFARSWQLVAHLSQVDNVLPHNLLENFLNEPLLLTRDGSDNVSCISNVCTHRGMILVEESCRRKRISCPYHGRCFSLDGSFLSMPEFEGVENFPSPKDDLPKIHNEIWNKFVFASLDPSFELRDLLREMDTEFGGFDFEDLELVSEKDYLVEAHWALYCENYLEGLHIPFVHKSLNRELDYGSYSTETFRYSSLQRGFDSDGTPSAHYFFIFPNLMFNFYPWGISVNIVKPEKRDLTRVSYMTLVGDESKLGRGAGADLGSVELEDQRVVESVQKGIESRFYDKGRYSPNREQGTHHFHMLICEFMNA